MKNELKRLDEFRKILSTYKMSETIKSELAKSSFIVLTAASSTGRNTIIRELLKSGKYHFVVSDTTRKPRINDGVLEQNGVEYWFKSEDEFIDGLINGKYLEAAIIHNQQVSGVNSSEILESNKNNKIAVTDIEVQGVDAIARSKPDIIAIFVLPPSLEEWMRRLKNRGKMPEDEIKRRLVSAVSEFDYAIKSKKFTYLINDDFHHSVKLIDKIVHEGKADIDYQKAAEKLIFKLRPEVKNLLSTLD